MRTSESMRSFFVIDVDNKLKGSRVFHPKMSVGIVTIFKKTQEKPLTFPQIA